MDIVDAIGFCSGTCFIGAVLLFIGGFIGWYTIYINSPKKGD